MYLGSIWTPHRTPIFLPTLTPKPSAPVLLLSSDEHAYLQGCPAQTPETTKCPGPWSLPSTCHGAVIIEKDFGKALPIIWTQSITISRDAPGRETPHEDSTTPSHSVCHLTEAS